MPLVRDRSRVRSPVAEAIFDKVAGSRVGRLEADREVRDALAAQIGRRFRL
jgi:hypothetical protein